MSSVLICLYIFQGNKKRKRIKKYIMKWLYCLDIRVSFSDVDSSLLTAISFIKPQKFKALFLPLLFYSFIPQINGFALVYTVSRQRLAAESRFRYQVNPYGICSVQSSTGTCFSLSTLILSLSVLFRPFSLLISVIYHRFYIILVAQRCVEYNTFASFSVFVSSTR